MRDALRQFLVGSLLGAPETAVGDDDDLLLSGLVDSVGVMRLVGWVEETCAVEIPPEDVTIENFGTIASVAAYVERLRTARNDTR